MIKSVKQMNTLDMISEAKHLYMQGVYDNLFFGRVSSTIFVFIVFRFYRFYIRMSHYEKLI